MKVLITGATGLIGKEVGKKLVAEGHQLFVLSRNRTSALMHLPFPAEVIEGDLNQGVVVDERLQQIEGVIHLAGESVAKIPWNSETKKSIYRSRIQGTENLRKSLPTQLKVIVAASGIGIYGDSADALLSEDSPLPEKKDFLSDVCIDWEKEVAAFKGRHVILRTGIVLSHQGGALVPMLKPFRVGVGGALGSGKQWMSWIALEDMVNMYVWAFNNESVSGVYNAVAPEPVTNKEFSKILADSLHRFSGLPAPGFALKTILGEASSLLLFSQKVSASKVIGAGFKFEFTNLKACLEKITAIFQNGEDLFYTEQFIPAPPEQIFEFFCSAYNLEKITPPLLNFRIASVSTPEIGQGTVIKYKLKIHGVPVGWTTLIDEWRPPFCFVDMQTSGPYSLWHHTHEFIPFAGGTLMTDRVRYKVPVGYLGWLLGGWLVKADVSKIFAYRRKYIFENMESIIQHHK